MSSYRLVDERLGDLLREFGPPRKAIHTEFPFWRLQGDRVWVLDRAGDVSVTASGDAHKTALLRHNVRGGLSEPIYDTLRADHRWRSMQPTSSSTKQAARTTCKTDLALCVLHHKLFDEGAFTLAPPSERSVVLVSEAANGTTGFDEWLGRFHKQVVRAPIRKTHRPNARFLTWNVREVFQSPERR